MPKINQYYIKPEIKKPVEIVQEVNKNNWWQNQGSIKKSSLSPSARSKVISKSGSSLQSEKESYGPCEYSSCPWPTNCRFYAKIGFSDSDFDITKFSYKGDIEGSYSWITMENIQQARDVLRKFEIGGEAGGYHVYEKLGIFSDNAFPSHTMSSNTRNALKKQDEIKEWLHERIKEHERRKDVYIARKDFYEDNSSCSQS